jgi:hypothetical protein
MKSLSPVMALPRRRLPAIAKVRQKLPSDHIHDVRGEVRRRLEGSGLGSKVKAGDRIAITAGSRGIGGFIDLLAGIADAVKLYGGKPFIVPAMGSHGGSTAEGQKEILRRLGVTEQTVGAPIRATMDTYDLGTAENGAVAHVDRFAAEAEGIIVLGRTKTHPESVGELASGLLKMCTIGLGKQIGAHEAHSHVLWDSVRAVPKIQLAKTRILFGVSVVENGYRQPCAIEVVHPSYEAFMEADMRLLKLAKAHLAHVPFDSLDLLIVDELGKTVSGGGMDPNVIGLWRNSDARHEPNYKRIVVLSLTYASLGNGLGIGMADFTTRRFADSYDPTVTYINLLTASEPESNTREGLLPLVLDTDQEAIEVALFSSLAGTAPRICRIKNTAELDELWVSPALLDEVTAIPNLQILQPPSEVEFSGSGSLL